MLGPGDLALNKTDVTKSLKSCGEDRYSGKALRPSCLRWDLTEEW